MFYIYSKPACPYCDQAKALLESKGLAYEEIMLDVGQLKQEDKQYIDRTDLLALFPGARTVPQIVKRVELERTHIGGFDQLRKYLSEKYS